ncbi:MAG: HEPN domain-containing protein [Theionarchaea archaeon]|nr:HEPN domain-containing protein [Theionarchaea archaeon]
MRREINNWWIQAERDLLSARNAFKSKDYYVTAFLCQQAVEKSLKALILHMKREFNPSHSLIYLGKSVGIPDMFHSFLRDLTPQYTISRYPNSSGEIPFELYDKKIASHSKEI